jgi:hypothetical protein
MLRLCLASATNAAKEPFSATQAQADATARWFSSLNGLLRFLVRKAPGHGDRRVQNEPAHGLLSWSSSLTVSPPSESPCRFRKSQEAGRAAATDSLGERPSCEGDRSRGASGAWPMASSVFSPKGAQRAAAILDTRRAAIERAGKLNRNDRRDVERVRNTVSRGRDRWRPAK